MRARWNASGTLTASDVIGCWGTWSRPGGGYFVWLRLAKGLSAARLLPVAQAAGTSFLPAGAFFLDRRGSPEALRLAFSMYPPATLEEGGVRLGSAVRSLIKR